MLDSANFAVEFKALAERDTPSTNSNWDVYPGSDVDSTWVSKGGLGFNGTPSEKGICNWSPLRAPSAIFLAEFTEVANRAGIVLGAPPGVNPSDYFLDCLYSKLIEKDGPFAPVAFRHELEFGRIDRACEAAVIFWLWRKTATDAAKHRFAAQPEIGVSRAGPDVRVTWRHYYTGGILLFRNEGTEAAKNVRLYCTESGWRPILGPQTIASIPPGGHFWATDLTKYGEGEIDELEPPPGQSIAEFVDSLSARQLTMTVVFEDQLGEERVSTFRVAGRSIARPELRPRVTFYLEGPASTVPPEQKTEEPLPPPPKADQAQPVTVPVRGSETDRRKAVDAYIEEIRRKTKKRITRTDIWKAARYKTRAEFERWEKYWYENRGRKPNKAANQRFTLILAEKPHLK